MSRWHDRLFSSFPGVPYKLSVISGVTPRYLVGWPNIYGARKDYVWHHVYARITKCKLKEGKHE
jgi:hypothetical protein